MDHLNKCPFCASTAIGIGLRYDGLYICDPERLHSGRYLAFSAICNQCGARGPIVKVEEGFSSATRHFAVETAATLWNGTPLE